MIHQVRGTLDILLARFANKTDAQIERGYVGGLESRKLKKSLAVANNLAARYALNVGENEIQSGSDVLRDTATGKRQKLEESELIHTLKR
jgi:histidyl-tRNA synthetase